MICSAPGIIVWWGQSKHLTFQCIVIDMLFLNVKYLVTRSSFLSLGLFHGVIAQSGSALASYSFHESPLVNFSNYVYQVGQLFDCNDDLLPDVVNCLRKVPFAAFIDKRQQVLTIFNFSSFSHTSKKKKNTRRTFLGISIKNSAVCSFRAEKAVGITIFQLKWFLTRAEQYK